MASCILCSSTCSGALSSRSGPDIHQKPDFCGSCTNAVEYLSHCVLFGPCCAPSGDWFEFGFLQVLVRDEVVMVLEFLGWPEFLYVIILSSYLKKKTDIDIAVLGCLCSREIGYKCFKIKQV